MCIEKFLHKPRLKYLGFLYVMAQDGTIRLVHWYNVMGDY